MASKVPTKPLCRNHTNDLASVVCLSEKQLLCTKCVIDGEHSMCKVKRIDRNNKLLVELISLEQYAETKRSQGELMEERIEEQREKVRTKIDETFEELQSTLEVMKERCKEEMESDYDKELEKVDKDKRSLEKVTESLQLGIDKMMQNDADPRLAMIDSEGIELKKRTAQKSLSQVPDRRTTVVFGKFELASNLLEILNGRRKLFGSTSLLMRQNFNLEK